MTAPLRKRKLLLLSLAEYSPRMHEAASGTLGIGYDSTVRRDESQTRVRKTVAKTVH